ncbi:hypothetical protein [Chryseobacterium sp. MP_3.2]|uniref:hypothetical protein n=1 Tax=Chryseobacterium sp. MP_3.2 TaxID=3071712 RepID=UPI002DFC36F3|nr:hypothetical protein [Chryseobacterium sp. MP_3.2]
MFKRHPIFLLLLGLLLIIGCRSDSTENSRAYVEGKVRSSFIDFDIYKIKIVQNDRIVAEAFLEKDGTFKLSGPISNEGYSITSPEKIASFSSDKQGLILSPDQHSIAVPTGNTYLKFNEIKLEE